MQGQALELRQSLCEIGFQEAISQTDAIWALEGFARTPFVDDVACRLGDGRIDLDGALALLSEKLMSSRDRSSTDRPRNERAVR